MAQIYEYKLKLTTEGYKVPEFIKKHGLTAFHTTFLGWSTEQPLPGEAIEEFDTLADLESRFLAEHSDEPYIGDNGEMSSADVKLLAKDVWNRVYGQVDGYQFVAVHPDTLLPVGPSGPSVAIERGYYSYPKKPVVLTTPPTGDVVEEDFPTVNNGIYTQTWKVRDFTAVELRREKIARKALTNVDRDKMINAGFDFNGDTFDSDEASRLNMMGAALGAMMSIVLQEDDQQIPWRLANNTNIQLNRAGLLGLASTLLQHILASYVASWDKKAQIDAATNKEEME